MGRSDAAVPVGNSRGGRGRVESWLPQFYYLGSATCRWTSPRRPGGQLAAHRLARRRGRSLVRRPVGQFACSNPLLNRIRDLVRWAQRSNMVSVLSDCPHREKLGWMEEFHLNGLSIRYELTWRGRSRRPCMTWPTRNATPGSFRHRPRVRGVRADSSVTAAEWGSGIVIVPWQQYLFTGDTDMLRTNFDAMSRYVAFLETLCDQRHSLRWAWRLVRSGAEGTGRSQLTPPPITATAFYFSDAWIFRMAPRCSARGGRETFRRQSRAHSRQL